MQILSDSQLQYKSNQNQFHACIALRVNWSFEVVLKF